MLFEVNGRPVYAYTGNKPVDPARRSIIFLHGAANDHSVWALQSRWFAHHGFNALALDLPGHGRSGGEALTSIGALANWTVAVLDALGLKRASLVGHSMGSLVALDAAARAPLRAERLALIGCAFPMAVADSLLAAAMDNPKLAIDLITGWSHAPASLLSGGALPGLWLPGLNRALMGRAAPGVLYRDLLNCREYEGGLAAAKKVTCPTLLVIGERDLMTPRKSVAALAAELTNRYETTITGAGHAMMSERADAVLDTLRDLVGGV